MSPADKGPVFISSFSDETLVAELQERIEHSRSFYAFQHLKEIDSDAFQAIEMTAMEILRQRNDEEWTVAHDDGHAEGEMAIAASCYARLAGEMSRATFRSCGGRGQDGGASP